jgi:glutamate-1-semialdehyde 2,1-aminomutase
MEKIMNVVAIVQARMESTRLPGKIMSKLNETPLIGILLARLSCSKDVNKIVVATSTDPKNKKLKAYLDKQGFECYFGNQNDVLDRYYNVAKLHKADVVVRITGDCPVVDPKLVDEFIKIFLSEKLDYLSNTIEPTYPDGLDIEVISFEALKDCFEKAESSYDREHVTPFIKNNPKYLKKNIKCYNDFSKLRLTVDEPEDLLLLDKVLKYFSKDVLFSWLQIIDLWKLKPEMFEINSMYLRNEGSIMNNGQKLWNRAKKVIPGGNMLLSKRPEMFLPEKWPAYFAKASGCKIFDLDGIEYTDMSMMGIGTNTLGYGHPEVDEAVAKVVQDGNMSTLNCPEEVMLAEKLVSLHPWAGMVKFARTGGEANAIAIRIARASSKRPKVAVCGYHGWHDWYLSVNLSNGDLLSDHLLPGLEPNGVPESLTGTVFPFPYNNFDHLSELVERENIGVIKMEVMRNMPPKDDFLIKVRNLANEKGIILIFDECTSGFRETFGGLHKKYLVEPDIAVFGKALGNGYAITAVVGRSEIMQFAQSTFISSTFWTERIGPAAGLKTLEVMERDKSWIEITNKGSIVRKKWKDLAKKYDLEINHSGIDSLATFSFQSEKNLQFKTFITQEMLKKGFLAGNSMYASVAHTDEIVELYFTELEPIFSKIKDLGFNEGFEKYLDSPVCHSGFERLN